MLSADKCAAEAPSISQLSGYRLRIKTHARCPGPATIASAFSSSPVAPRFKRARLVIAVITYSRRREYGAKRGSRAGPRSETRIPGSTRPRRLPNCEGQKLTRTNLNLFR